MDGFELRPEVRIAAAIACLAAAIALTAALAIWIKPGKPKVAQPSSSQTEHASDRLLATLYPAPQASGHSPTTAPPSSPGGGASGGGSTPVTQLPTPTPPRATPPATRPVSVSPTVPPTAGATPPPTVPEPGPITSLPPPPPPPTSIGPPPSTAAPTTTSTSTTTSTTLPTPGTPPPTTTTTITQIYQPVRPAALVAAQPAAAPATVNVDVPALHLAKKVVATAVVLGGQLQVALDELHPVDASATTGGLVREFAIAVGPDVHVALTSSDLDVAAGQPDTAFLPTTGSQPPRFSWEVTPRHPGLVTLRFTACSSGEAASSCAFKEYQDEVRGQTYLADATSLVTGHLVQLFPSVSLFEIARFGLRLRRRRRIVAAD